MIHGERLHRPGYVYPTDPWRLVETRFYPRYLAQTETFFSLSNGYLGIRGAFEEGTPAYCNATLVNGFHEKWPITYGEVAFGFATTGQTIVNVPDGKIFRLYVDDEPFDLATAKLLEFERALDMRRGCLERRVLWEAPAGKVVSIRSTRLVSFEQRHLAGRRLFERHVSVLVDRFGDARDDLDFRARQVRHQFRRGAVQTCLGVGDALGEHAHQVGEGSEFGFLHRECGTHDRCAERTEGKFRVQ